VHSAAGDDMGRYRLGWWLVVASLAAGCAAAEPARPVATDQGDVWFMQHMVPYLRQTTAIVALTRDHLTDPTLARLADAITRSAQADIGQLQGWLDRRGLAPHGHSHQRVDSRGQTDMERLSRLRGAALNQAFVQVMTARYRNGIKLAETEATTGSLPEVRQLARRLLAEQQARTRQMTSWQRALTTASTRCTSASCERSTGLVRRFTGRRPCGIADLPRCRR
jgi:uncharacterized protein (DUF305 family)